MARRPHQFFDHTGTKPTEFATVIETQRAKWAVIARENNIERE